MNWIRDNKFLAGLFGVVTIGVIVFGVLIFLASGRYKEVSATYDTQLKKLQSLEGAKVYPNDANLTKVNELKSAYAAEVLALRRRLSEQNFPLEEISPSHFQDRLRQAVGEVIGAASEREVELEEGFYLGFDRYQAQPPKPEAASYLARELGVIKMLADKLILAGIDNLSIARMPLPVEGDSPTAGKEDKKKNQSGGADSNLVQKAPVIVGFRCDPRVFREVLNRMSSAEKFLIIRTLNVHNTSPEGPKRGATVSSSGFLGTPPEMAEVIPESDGLEGLPASAPAGEAETPRMEFVVGSEKLDVSMRVEIVDFAPVEDEKKATPTGA